jgi:CxxC motif-containing protein
VKQLTCIVCPNGCRISAELLGGQVVLTGNKCARGAEFAQTELTAPTRSVTTTVRTIFSTMPALPVKTAGEIPKALIPALIKALADVTVTRRVGFGDTVAENVLDTGVDVIACGNLEESKPLRSAAGKEHAHA